MNNLNAWRWDGVICWFSYNGFVQGKHGGICVMQGQFLPSPFRIMPKYSKEVLPWEVVAHPE